MGTPATASPCSHRGAAGSEPEGEVQLRKPDWAGRAEHRPEPSLCALRSRRVPRGPLLDGIPGWEGKDRDAVLRQRRAETAGGPRECPGPSGAHGGPECLSASDEDDSPLFVCSDEMERDSYFLVSFLPGKTTESVRRARGLGRGNHTWK